jgi:hypothetical protein
MESYSGTEIINRRSRPPPLSSPSTINTPDLDIYTRPEIRKGCLWDVQLRFKPEFVKQHQLTHISVEKPRGASDNTYLCLKIRSKLIKPIREIPFTKVAQTVTSEGEVLYFNDFSTVTLKVKFTARPRAVFHKHSDMMILLVSVKKGERVIASSEAELIFRGGTGSIHSAETRKATSRDGPAPLPIPHNSTPHLVSMPATTNGFPLSSPPATRIIPSVQEESKPLVLPPSQPSQAVKNLPSFLSQSSDDSPYHPVLEFEDFDSQQLCSDFLQNKGDALLSVVGGVGSHTFDDLENPENDYSNGLWAEHLFSEYEPLTFFPRTPAPTLAPSCHSSTSLSSSTETEPHCVIVAPMNVESAQGKVLLLSSLVPSL